MKFLLDVIFATLLTFLTYPRSRRQFFYDEGCLVPVQRFPRPSRSIHFGDAMANGQETLNFSL